MATIWTMPKAGTEATAQRFSSTLLCRQLLLYSRHCVNIRFVTSVSVHASCVKLTNLVSLTQLLNRQIMGNIRFIDRRFNNVNVEYVFKFPNHQADFLFCPNFFWLCGYKSRSFYCFHGPTGLEYSADQPLSPVNVWRTSVVRYAPSPKD